VGFSAISYQLSVTSYQMRVFRVLRYLVWFDRGA
jgi:hypothetical protein